MITGERGHTSTVSLLLQAPGLHINKVDHEGRTSLSIAARMGKTAVVKALLQSGAEVGTALVFASYFGVPAVVVALLEAGAEVK
jgi:ankyrin repeat protein